MLQEALRLSAMEAGLNQNQAAQEQDPEIGDIGEYLFGH